MDVARFYFNRLDPHEEREFNFENGEFPELKGQFVKPEWKCSEEEIVGGAKLAWEIGYYGYIARLYGTVDIYAKKLELNESPEQNKLKLAINAFFCIWNKVHRSFKINEREDGKSTMSWPSRSDKQLKAHEFEFIDRRYISLMSSILERKDGIRIKDNIRFITWNYDLQIERAYNEFLKTPLTYQELANGLPFSLTSDVAMSPVIHLNGYHGYYFDSKFKEHSILDELSSPLPSMFNSAADSISWIISKLGGYRNQLNDDGSLNLGYNNQFLQTDSHMAYAWEQKQSIEAKKPNEIQKMHAKMLESAFKIMQNTDILVIIGYSFPTFNKEVDQHLLSQSRATKIIYQDPNASEELIKSYFVKSNKFPKIILEPNTSSFRLPFEF